MQAEADEIPRDVRRLILFGAVVTTAIGTAGTAFLPYLSVHQPLGLLATSADGRNLLLVAGRVELPWVLLVGVPRRVIAMLVTYGMGRLYGRALLAWSSKRFPRVGAFIAWSERAFQRFAAPAVLLWPAYATSALGGVTRMRFRLYLPLMVVGQVGFVVVFFYLGEAIGAWTNVALDFLARHLWESSAVFAAAVLAQQLVALFRRRRARDRANEQAAG